MFITIGVIIFLSLIIGVALGISAIKFKVDGDPIIEKIDSILPQTQCGQCGYPGCKPYATAIANGEADINQCPPGGDDGIHKLADLLGVDYKPLNEEHGVTKPKSVAIIDEKTCIGCTLCIQACPVDAILGSAKHMHTIIEKECTGCELCLPPCPVDCIEMVPIKETTENWKWKYPVHKLKVAERAAP
jgi:electron transport complex protein RnfB